MKALLIIGMAFVGVAMSIYMKKIAPEDKIYPFWALLVVILFAIVVIFHR